ncbi:HNH/endonuclease VII fold putative polymorphic toxin [Salmonella enterica]|uniref:HNH/endonuclease VII fold putative polymorphic toxin n=1 Tax=Salmonella enterica TaxID=28901 RepID=UPI001285F362|nr:hypothetical protein [Salmonella enterica]EBG5226227.1 hypothetical protein [Salmonella enterica subsp. enterica serovar Luckenwalde]EBY5613170.1 hypothetical protein [Salmonella enterica subsp. enterica serovar Chicago]ECE6310969.1 hypothetical protein [Salmonella enterica subsp. enterica]HAU6778412.1 hypothetical protein [Salmonella enterica subsp. enterica serovar Luckenwalde]
MLPGSSCTSLPSAISTTHPLRDLGSHGRYYEYTDARGHKRVIVELTADPRAPGPHTHVGQPKPSADPRTYDFKNDRYQKINNLSANDHHIYYDY